MKEKVFSIIEIIAESEVKKRFKKRESYSYNELIESFIDGSKWITEEAYLKNK